MTIDPLAWHCSTIPDGPAGVQEVFTGMRKSNNNYYRHTFYDRTGQSIHVPTKPNGDKAPTRYFHDGYAKALWDLRINSLLLGDDNHTIYVRDVDETGSNQLLETWHAISSLEAEYHIPSRQAYLPWNQQLRIEAMKLPSRIRHGIKFNNIAFVREHGKITRLKRGDQGFDMPFEVSSVMAYDTTLARKAVAFLRNVTADEHSAQNLARMFATPLLEPYKHLSYVLYGAGGNGKGILLSSLRRSFPDLSTSVDAQRLLGGRRGGGGFGTEQETGKLIGALWAFDEDADTISVEQMTLLKKISTGDTVIARRIQENSVSFAPKCVFVIATNNPVITTMTAASARRFVYIRMRDGRKPEEFDDLLDFTRQYGAAPFLMASCKLWQTAGDEPYRDVVIGSSNDLSQAEQWLVDEIVAQGYAVSGDNPYRETPGDHINSVNKLGLVSSVKKIDGAAKRVLKVIDEQRFSPYRSASEAAIKDATKETITLRPKPIEGDIPSLAEFGFNADYVEADAHKIARNWKRQVENPNIDTSQILETPAYAVVPAPGFAILDLDMGKTETEPDGWTLLQLAVGAYGSDSFPTTYLVGTPSGGTHAYYKLPAELRGKLKNSVHPDGIPIDVRTERRGYVIGAGSTTENGDYELLDLPEATIPTMPPALVAWLEANGYVEGNEPAPAKNEQAKGNRSTALPSVAGVLRFFDSKTEGTPDMSAIPEGQRNSTLFEQTLGRLIHYPQNLTQIRRDLYQRGHLSGLKDAELETIWQSAVRTSKETTKR
jgi:hypothetical protein